MEQSKTCDSMLKVPIFEELKTIDGPIILAGCGGGFDIYCGIPFYFALKELGKEVYFANLTFVNFDGVTDAELIGKDCKEITTKSRVRGDYFPEYYISKWFEETRKEHVPVYMLNRVACKRLHAAYEELVKKLKAKCIVLIDGGTDSLMRGDESGLGSPQEDMSSIGAVDMLDVPHKYLTLLGFGIDSFHGVSHALFLENVAALIKSGGFLGTFSLMKEMKEASMFQEICDYAFKRSETSIVNGSISAAISGEYGDFRFTPRTGNSKLWINPLMSMYWCFKLANIAKNAYKLDDIKKSETYGQLHDAIYRREHLKIRKPFDIPV